MTFVAGDHEARVTVTIGNLDVGVVLNKELDNLDMAVETGSTQSGRVRLGRRVDVSSFAN